MDNKTYVTHYDSARAAEQPPESLNDYIAWLQAKLAEVPVASQASAEVEFYFDGNFAIRYAREASAEEMAERLAAKRARDQELRRARKARALWEDRLAEQMQGTACTVHLASLSNWPTPAK